MKVLSKFKDYYDYQVGVYGEDPLLIYDRRNGQGKINIDFDTVITVFIGNKVIQGIIIGGEHYWGDDLKKYTTGPSTKDRWFHEFYLKINGNARYSFTFNRTGKKFREFIYHDQLEKTNNKSLIELKQKALDYPISLHIPGRKSIPNPQLESIGINKVLPPSIVWQELSDYFSQQNQAKEKTVPIGNDQLRIQSHGFDLKSSFRNNQTKKH